MEKVLEFLAKEAEDKHDQYVGEVKRLLKAKLTGHGEFQYPCPFCSNINQRDRKMVHVVCDNCRGEFCP